jgi:predicted DNA-binding transcriptional regulator
MIRTLALAMGATLAAAQTHLNNKGVTGCTRTKQCGLCEGDCDNDHDCKTGMTCFQRNGMQPIPGCTSGGRMDRRGYDFCYFTSTGNNMGLTTHEVVNKGWSGCSNTKPCAICQGDCDNDKQCQAPLKCFQRKAMEQVPGCTMTGGNAGRKTRSVDFCYDATAGTNMGLVHHNLVVKGWSGCKTTAPCAMCEGDCDNDKECTAPLKCFQRNGMQKVPGCTAGNTRKTRSVDFCYDATAGTNMGLVHHNLVNKGWSGCSNTKPCAMCEGDCDSDKQCTAPLKCFQRNGNQRVPGCSNRGNSKKTKSVDFCYDATAGNNMGMKHHNLVNKGISGCTRTKRCGLCQGDCDSDLDCAPSLKCFQRNGLQPVPGCNMVKRGNRRGFDFCFFPGHGYNPHQGGGGH